ncbi:MAG: thiol reductant ABC exporter subunit CydD [Thermoleophilales bacterium]|nr:thiol reductant ABC exporter subunit CydD [Thermoleophilales bacterium]
MSATSKAPGASRQARETQRRLARSSRVARKHLAVTVGLGALQAGLIIAQATLLAKVIAGVFMDGDSFADVAPWLLWLAVISIGRGLAAAGFESAGRFGAARVMSELRERLSRHLLLDRPGALQDEQSGDLVSSAIDGVAALENYFARYLPQMVLAGIVPVAVLAWVVQYNWESAVILAVTAPLIIVFMVLIGLLTEQRTRKRWERMSRLSSHFLDLVGGLATLRANSQAFSQAGSIQAVGEEYRRETMGALRVGFLSSLVLELLAMIGVAMVATAIGIQLAGGHLELVAGLTVLLLAPELYMPLRQLGAQFHASADGMAAAERIFEVIDRPVAVSQPAEPVPAPDPARWSVAMEGVSYAWPGRERVLESIDLELEPGETVALVGPSGGGKSTLASLLLRLAEPKTGRITCGGVSLSEVNPRDWRRQIAWVPQRPTIFADTLAGNLRLFNPQATDGQLAEAVGVAVLGDLVASLPRGLDTMVGEGGRRLSAGQTQRIALARALLSDAPLLILDEPTAHLDQETERELADAINEVARDRTALIISHRDQPIARADRTLVLDHGVLSQTAGAGAAGGGPSGIPSAGSLRDREFRRDARRTPVTGTGVEGR